MPHHPDTLEQARRDLELSRDDLWFRYFELGGMSTAFELEAYMCNALTTSPHDSDLVAVALNERFAELGKDHPIPYSDDEALDPVDRDERDIV